MAERPWGSMRNGKGMTEAWLAEQLRPYDIRPRTVRIGKEVLKGYWAEDFEEVFRRYLPASEIEALRAELEQAATDAPTAVCPSPEFKDQTSGAENPEDSRSGPRPEAGSAPEDDAAAA